MKHSILEAFEKGRKLIESSDPKNHDHWSICNKYRRFFREMYLDDEEDELDPEYFKNSFYARELDKLIDKHFRNLTFS